MRRTHATHARPAQGRQPLHRPKDRRKCQEGMATIMTQAVTTPRYCHCGARLARDNRGTRCTPCQRSARERVSRAPDVPPTFWESSDRLRDALEAWHMGRVIAAYRTHPFHACPLNQAVVAGWMGITQTQLSRIEVGLPITDLAKLIRWAEVLRIPEDRLWFKVSHRKRVPALANPPQALLSATPAGVAGEVRALTAPARCEPSAGPARPDWPASIPRNQGAVLDEAATAFLGQLRSHLSAHATDGSLPSVATRAHQAQLVQLYHAWVASVRRRQARFAVDR